MYTFHRVHHNYRNDALGLNPAYTARKQLLNNPWPMTRLHQQSGYEALVGEKKPTFRYSQRIARSYTFVGACKTIWMPNSRIPLQILKVCANYKSQRFNLSIVSLKAMGRMTLRTRNVPQPLEINEPQQPGKLMIPSAPCTRRYCSVFCTDYLHTSFEQTVGNQHMPGDRVLPFACNSKCSISNNTQNISIKFGTRT